MRNNILDYLVKDVLGDPCIIKLFSNHISDYASFSDAYLYK